MLSSLPKIDLNPAAETVSEVVKEADKQSFNWLPVVIIVAGIIIAVTVISIVIIKVLKKRKKTEPVRREEAPKQSVYCEKPDVVKHSGKTMHLWGTGETAEKQMYVYLSDIREERRIFRAPINDSIIIGRKEGDIVITDDASLSRRHCKIIKRGSSYYVEDLDSANGTRYEGDIVTGEMPILPGGILTIGRHSMKVEMIED